MEAYSKHHGIVLPLDRANVDTDAIIPATYLKMITRTGFAEGLFSNWRYRSRTREPNPEFVLNMPRYVGATVLLARENLGCGSSREHAPWALWEYGFKTLIASSFADIFYNNCLNVGILPIRLEAGLIQSLFEEVEANEGYALDIDLPAQTVTTSTGRVLAFELDPFRKDALLRGLDPIGYTLQYQASIAAYEQRRKQELPWYFHDIPA